MTTDDTGRGDDAQAAADQEHWNARALRVTTEVTALALAIGLEAHNSFRIEVTADPAQPDDGNPNEERHFYLDVDELSHAPGGWINGTERVRYELTLVRIGPTPTPSPSPTTDPQ